MYIRERAHLAKTLDKWDKDGSGRLEKSEMKQYLTSLNGGRTVDDSEVDWVFAVIDVVKDGSIGQPELMLATAAWYVNHEEVKAKSRICAVL